MDRSSLFKILLGIAFCCLVVVGFAHTKDVFANAEIANKVGGINANQLMQ